jgi:exonuclease VII small subunit
MEQKEATITLEDIIAAMEQTWTHLERALEQFEPLLDAGPDAG